MSQKIYDILPIDKDSSEKESSENSFRKISYNFPEKEIKKEYIKLKPKLGNLKKYLFFLFVLVFLFSGIWSYISFSFAEVEIWLKTEDMILEEDVVIDPNIDYVDVVNGIIRGEIFSETGTEVQNFPTTGKSLVEKKAAGVIRVYNSHSTESQALVENTRFVSSDGKLFRSIKRETIPGGKYVSGKLDPGFLDIEVIAAEAGEDYNIGPTSFSIPGFVGTPKYADFYGKSSSPMKGGFKGEASIISKEDIENAKVILEKNILNSNYKKVLEKGEKEGYVFFIEDIIFKKEILEESTNIKEGEIAENFDYTIKIKTDFLGFKKTDIKIFADNLISEKLITNQKAKDNSLKINYKSININDGKNILVTALYETEIYNDIDLLEIKKSLLGEERDKIRTYLLSLPQIERVQINSWPLFKKRAPIEEEKISIKVNI